MNTKPLILYHGDCPDGFGGAFAAWKKFGNSAEYKPMKYGHAPVTDETKDREVYFIDLCFPMQEMHEILKVAKSLTVLDHHEGVQEVAKSIPNHVYDANRSGATIAWEYFHPETPIPFLFKILEDEDLYRFKLPETRPIGVYISAHPFSFQLWEELASQLEDEGRREALLRKAEVYVEYFNYLVDYSVNHAHPIHFEGHTVLLANSISVKTLKSAIGHKLAEKMPPFGLVVSVHPNGLGVSIRGDGSVDVSKIAQKYGGNGHPSSSGFRIPWQTPMPFTSAEEDENPRD